MLSLGWRKMVLLTLRLVSRSILRRWSIILNGHSLRLSRVTSARNRTLVKSWRLVPSLVRVTRLKWLMFIVILIARGKCNLFLQNLAS